MGWLCCSVSCVQKHYSEKSSHRLPPLPAGSAAQKRLRPPSGTRPAVSRGSSVFASLLWFSKRQHDWPGGSRRLRSALVQPLRPRVHGQSSGNVLLICVRCQHLKTKGFHAHLDFRFSYRSRSSGDSGPAPSLVQGLEFSSRQLGGPQLLGTLPRVHVPPMTPQGIWGFDSQVGGQLWGDGRWVGINLTAGGGSLSWSQLHRFGREHLRGCRDQAQGMPGQNAGDLGA